MKKLLFLLLCTVASYGQTYQNPTFGTVTTKTTPTVTTPAFIGTLEATGVNGKIPSTYIEKTSNKQNSLAPDGTGVKFPTVDAVNAALPVTYAKVVYVNDVDPNTATIFDLENPPTVNDDLLKNDTNNLYIGTDASTWVYNGSIYVTKMVTSETSNFYLLGTTTDAGNTKTGSLSRNGSIYVGENPLNTKSYFFGQKTASNDIWRIYGEASVIDRGIMVFETGDNGTSHAAGGQKFEFRYNAASSGVAKTPLTIDYNEITANANLTATSFVKSGATSTDALLAGGGTLANPISGTGTINSLSKWTGTNTQGNSNVSDSGSFVTITAPVRGTGGTNTEYLAGFSKSALQDFSGLSTSKDRTVTVQGASGAYFAAKDITNNIDFVMGTSTLGVGFLGTTTMHGLDFRTNSVSRFAISTSGVLSIVTTPTTSPATYDFLTRNTSTGVVEKIPSANIATTAYVNTATTNNGIITTAANITNATLTDSSLPQNGKTLYISNGTTNINYTVNGSITASFVKGGTGSITFVQGSGRTMVAANGTLVFNGAQYSTASIVSFGTTDIVYINNF